jgi:hypothetical protein
LGFGKKNKGDTNDGFGMLPDHMRAGLKSKTLSAFLRHGGLKHLTTAKAFQKDDDVELAVAPRTLPNWCHYPPPKVIGVWTERCDELVHITSIIANALSKPVGTFVASGIVEEQRQNDSCAMQKAY